MAAISSERIFNKHAAAHALPLLGDSETRDSYIDQHATTDETARCFNEAFDAADVADHVEVARWFAQARNSYVPPARTKSRA